MSNQQLKPADKVSNTKGGDDFTTILDGAQRADLTLLIANITESMRKLVTGNFDASAGLDKSLLREDMTQDEKLMIADPASTDVIKLDRERKLKEYEKSLPLRRSKTSRTTLSKHMLSGERVSCF
jgi:hypothetical protein